MGKKKVMSHKDISLLGGQATLEKRGAKHYKKMARKRWKLYRERKAAGVI